MLIELLVLHNNTRNHLTECKGTFVVFKCNLQTIRLQSVYIYKQDLVLNN